MRTVAVLASKGGTGKTTVSVHLACAAVAAGRKALIADIDPQQSARDWKRERGAAQPAVTETRTGALFAVREGARRAGCDLFVIDTRPSADEDTLAAVRLADLCLIVVRPSFLDMRAVTRTVELVERQRKRAVFLVNQAPPQRSGQEAPAMLAAIRQLRAMGPDVASIGLRSRGAYQQAMAQGLSAPEFEPGSNAAIEIERLWRWLDRELYTPTPAPVRTPVRPIGLFQRAPVATLAAAATAN